VLLGDAPAPLDRIVLAVVGRVVGQADGQAGGGRERHEAGDELAAMAVVLRPVVQVEDQRGAVREARAHRRPPLRQAVGQAVAGHARGHRVEEHLLQLGQQQAHRRHRAHRLAVVVGGGDRDPAPPFPREGAALDRRFGLHGDPPRVARRVGGAVDGRHLGEAGVGRGDLLWGGVLATVWG